MSELKKTKEEKAKIYLKNSLTKELQETLFPMCNQTCAEICVEDYLSGYNQAIQDLESPELLEKLKESVKVIEWYMENTNPKHGDYQTFHDLGMNIRMSADELINNATR